jgi:hypothetical protein
MLEAVVVEEELIQELQQEQQEQEEVEMVQHLLLGQLQLLTLVVVVEEVD